MQARSDDVAVTTEGTAVWCDTCGIPYGPTITHCSHCGAPLADDITNAVSGLTVVPFVQLRPSAASMDAAIPATIAGATAQLTLPAATSATIPPGLLGRIRTRQQPMSDDEVDAAAAAIIAQARAEERGNDVAPIPREALDLLQDSPSSPVVQQILQEKRDRDRLWLVAGVICCVLLLLFALAISRYMSVGLLRR